MGDVVENYNLLSHAPTHFFGCSLHCLYDCCGTHPQVSGNFGITDSPFPVEQIAHFRPDSRDLSSLAALSEFHLQDRFLLALFPDHSINQFLPLAIPQLPSNACIGLQDNLFHKIPSAQNPGIMFPVFSAVP
jgi:hypothetical protein